MIHLELKEVPEEKVIRNKFRDDMKKIDEMDADQLIKNIKDAVSQYLKYMEKKRRGDEE